MRSEPSPESQRIFAPGIFAGKVAVITGGGSGIGLVAATEFARLGGRVAICGRTIEKLEKARDQIAAASSAEAVFFAGCDIREPEQVKAFVSGTLAAFGSIDILVNNAGGQFPSPAQHISPNGFAAVIKNNLIGTFHVTNEVANQAMIPAKQGVILNITANVFRGFPGMVHTGAARAGVENMTKTLAVEWSQFGIRVNAIAPGVIRSTGTDRYPPELVKMAVSNTPAKRIGTIEEVVASILFLASPAAQYISGATLQIDGGQCLWGDTWQLPD